MCLVFLFSPAAGHAAEEEALAVEQSHPAPDLLPGGHRGQRPRDLHHPQLRRLPGPAL